MEMEELENTVERCREGDEDAWSALVNTTLRPIYRLCASYAPTAAEAEELTQEVYFKLWENLHRYNAGSNFMAWAWRVAKNLIIDSYRRGRRERDAAWLDPEILDRLPGSDNPHEQAERRQRLGLIGVALRQTRRRTGEPRADAGLCRHELSGNRRSAGPPAGNRQVTTQPGSDGARHRRPPAAADPRRAPGRRAG